MSRDYRPIGYKHMTTAQRREYHRERQQAHRMLVGRPRHHVIKPKPAEVTCRSCKTAKPFNGDHFYASKQAAWGLMKMCKPCMVVRQSARKFGISVDEYMLRTTGVCAICDTPSKLVLDHCHETGNLREGLCNGCNTGLGMFRDSISNLHRASEYLAKHQMLS